MKIRKETREHQSKLYLLYLFCKTAQRSLEPPTEFEHLLLTDQLTPLGTMGRLPGPYIHGFINENKWSYNGNILETPSKELKVTLFSLSLEPYYKQEVSFCHLNCRGLESCTSESFWISELKMTILIILQRMEEVLNLLRLCNEPRAEEQTL